MQAKNCEIFRQNPKGQGLRRRENRSVHNNRDRQQRHIPTRSADRAHQAPHAPAVSRCPRPAVPAVTESGARQNQPVSPLESVTGEKPIWPTIPSLSSATSETVSAPALTQPRHDQMFGLVAVVDVTEGFFRNAGNRLFVTLPLRPDDHSTVTDFARLRGCRHPSP